MERHTVLLLIYYHLSLLTHNKLLSTTITTTIITSINKRIINYSDYVPTVGTTLVYNVLDTSSIYILFPSFIIAILLL